MGFIALIAALVFGIGAVGGTINALVTDNGFVMPKRKEDVQGSVIIQPGVIGNALIGGFAAFVSWAMYGPLSATAVEIAAGSTGGIELAISSLGAAGLVGFAGARWLTNEVEKKLFGEVAQTLANKQPDAAAADQLRKASATQALEIARGLESAA